MTVSKIIIVRHATRIDSVNKNWSNTSPCPYDPPLADKGFDEASQTASSLVKHIDENEHVVVHSSPFLRCVQTAVTIANKLPHPVLRLDATFGEWQSTDYFTDISPPPPDGHRSIAENASTWYYLNHINSINETKHSLLDTTWPLQKFGFGGDYGESWSTMHNRFINGLKQLVKYYDDNTEDNDNLTIVIVTHGAGCNSLLGLLSNLPLLTKIGLASFAVAKRQLLSDDDFKWTIIFNSNKSESEDTSTNSSRANSSQPPLLSSSNSTSYSSISDITDDDESPSDLPPYQLNWFAPTTSTVPTLANLVFDVGTARPGTPLHERNTSNEEPILLSFGSFAPSSAAASKSLHSSPSMTPTRS